MSSELIFLQDELNKRLNQIQQLQNQKRKFIRAHQTLPRWRRRRQMSWNYKRFPQALRPRALNEILTNKPNITDKNNSDIKELQPKRSRKYRRTRIIYKLPRYIGKRCKVLKIKSLNTVTRLTVKQNTKMVRFLERSESAVIDRSMSFYVVVKALNIKQNEYIIQIFKDQNVFEDNFEIQKKKFLFLPGNVPAEIIYLNENEIYLIIYRYHLDLLRNAGVEYVISDYTNCVVFNVEADKYSKICQLLKENTVNNTVIFQTLPYNAFRQRNDTDQIQNSNITQLPSQIKLQNAELLAHNYLEQMTPQFKERIGKLIKQKINKVIEGTQRVQDIGLPIQNSSQNCINQINNCVFSNLLLQHNQNSKTLTILATPESMALLYQKINPIAGAVEKRFLCYSNKILDLLQVWNIQQIEKLIYKSQVPKQFHLTNKQKLILGDREVIKNIFTRSETYIRLEERKEAKQSQETNEQQICLTSFKNFVQNNFTFVKEKLENMKKLYSNKYGREIGISSTGELEKVDVLL